MAYRDDIATLGADHLWILDGDSTDNIGTATGTDTSVLYTDTSLTKDATNCMTTNAVGDSVVLPSLTTIGNAAQTRKAFAGWFQTTAIQPPPKRIYGEGTASPTFQFVMAYGNNVMFECAETPNYILQVFGPVMQPNRTYHLCGIFEGSGFGNEIRFYVDGVEQLNASPVNRQPADVDLAIRAAPTLGDPAGTVGIGGDIVLLTSSINGKYQHWAAWGDKASAILTETQVRVTLFERGALAEQTITTDTQANMQIAVDALLAQPDAPCCIEVEAVTGGGNFTLTSDVTFDAAASIHVRYNGTADTLTWINVSGGAATIGSAPFGGSILLVTRQTLSVTVTDVVTTNPVENARVFIEADTGGPLAQGTVIMNALTTALGEATATFDYSADQPITGRVRKGTTTPVYKTQQLTGTIDVSGLTQSILLIPDE